MPEEHLVVDITQKALLLRAGRVLVTRDLADTLWGLPGGRIHVGERTRAGVIREMQEETGLDVAPVAVFETTIVITPNGRQHYGVIYLCVMADPEQDIRLQADEVADYRWVNHAEVGELPLIEEYAAVLDRFFSGRHAWLQRLNATLTAFAGEA